MLINSNSVVLVATAALVTLLLRLAPFVIFGGKRRMPDDMQRAAKLLPPAIMGVLVIYCIKGDLINLRDLILSLLSLVSPANAGADAAFLVNPGATGSVAACGIALLTVGALHLWKRKTLLSIAAGTIVYMALIRLLP